MVTKNEGQAHDVNHRILKTDLEKIAFEGALVNLLSLKMLRSAQALKEGGLI